MRACIVATSCVLIVVATVVAALRQRDAGYGIPAQGAATLVRSVRLVRETRAYMRACRN